MWIISRRGRNLCRPQQLDSTFPWLDWAWPVISRYGTTLMDVIMKGEDEGDVRVCRKCTSPHGSVV